MFNKSKVLIILAFMCGMFLLVTPTKVEADAGEVRTIYLSATEYDYPPFSVTDSGEADGFSVDLLKAVAIEMGINVTFKIDQWSVLKEELKNGEIDILPLVGYTEERDEVYDFTVPYIVMRGNIFVRKGYDSIQSEEDLKGKKILVLDGDNSQEWAWSIGLNSELTATTTYLEAFQLLNDGEYDAVLAQGLVGEKLISDYNLSNIEAVYTYENDGLSKQKLNLEGYEQKFCFAVVEDDDELLSILNEGLSIVSQNGTYDELYQKWFPFLIEKESVKVTDVLEYVAYALIPILILFTSAYFITTRRTIKIKTEQIDKNKKRNEIIVEAFQKKFSTETERFDYVLREIVDLSESSLGFMFSVNGDGKVYLRTTCSKIEKKLCDENTILNLISENTLIQETIHDMIPKLENDYDLNSQLTICGEKIERIMTVVIAGIEQKHVVVLLNKDRPYSKDNINQTSILLTGLWTMLERADQLNKIEYISFHDSLTGLYNRRFFEEEIIRLDNPRNYPISIIMGDVNGLKLVNDAFGHSAGDELLKIIGSIILKNSRGNDVSARWGGDEFAIIMPNTTLEQAEVFTERVHEETKKVSFKFGAISISFGINTKTVETEIFKEIFSSAEEVMYQNKLEVQESVRGETIQTIMNTLFEKSKETKEHSERVSKIAVSIAEALGLSKSKVNDIKTIGTVHDIGKIIIDSSILEKPEPLTDHERKIIEQHPVSGSKMLLSSREYTRLASGVLHHHERIDGTGYPNGLKGDEIPMESKIIAIADAFDAMTSTRFYRKDPLSIQDAVHELKVNSGTQFDEELVNVYINKVLKMNT